ncbi:hypothetical protein EK904_008429, partial [Melospiza melodia maxima]
MEAARNQQGQAESPGNRPDLAMLPGYLFSGQLTYYGTQSKNPIGTHTHGAEMFQQLLGPFPDPHLQELTAPSVP